MRIKESVASLVIGIYLILFVNGSGISSDESDDGILNFHKALESTVEDAKLRKDIVEFFDQMPASKRNYGAARRIMADLDIKPNLSFDGKKRSSSAYRVSLLKESFGHIWRKFLTACKFHCHCRPPSNPASCGSCSDTNCPEVPTNKNVCAPMPICKPPCELDMLKPDTTKNPKKPPPPDTPNVQDPDENQNKTNIPPVIIDDGKNNSTIKKDNRPDIIDNGKNNSTTNNENPQDKNNTVPPEPNDKPNNSSNQEPWGPPVKLVTTRMKHGWMRKDLDRLETLRPHRPDDDNNREKWPKCDDLPELSRKSHWVDPEPEEDESEQDTIEQEQQSRFKRSNRKHSSLMADFEDDATATTKPKGLLYYETSLQSVRNKTIRADIDRLFDSFSADHLNEEGKTKMIRIGRRILRKFGEQLPPADERENQPRELSRVTRLLIGHLWHLHKWRHCPCKAEMCSHLYPPRGDPELACSNNPGCPLGQCVCPRE